MKHLKLYEQFNGNDNFNEQETEQLENLGFEINQYKAVLNGYIGTSSQNGSIIVRKRNYKYEIYVQFHVSRGRFGPDERNLMIIREADSIEGAIQIVNNLKRESKFA